MREPKIYDIFIGILHYMSADANKFRYDKKEITEFLQQKKEDYDILNNFKEGQVDHLFHLLTWGAIKSIPENKDIKKFEKEKID